MADWLQVYAAAAQAASAAEQAHQREAARRAAELREARAFAWRRLGLMRAVAAAAQDAEAPEAAGCAAMLEEAGLSAAGDAGREVAERFAPVAAAVAAGDPEAALAAFEAWYAVARGRPFLALMEREVVELPLVEV